MIGLGWIGFDVQDAVEKVDLVAKANHVVEALGGTK